MTVWRERRLRRCLVWRVYAFLMVFEHVKWIFFLYHHHHTKNITLPEAPPVIVYTLCTGTTLRFYTSAIRVVEMPLQGDSDGCTGGGGGGGGGGGRWTTKKLGAVAKAVAVTVGVDKETAARSTKNVRNGKYVTVFPRYGHRNFWQRLSSVCVRPMYSQIPKKRDSEICRFEPRGIWQNSRFLNLNLLTICYF